MLYEVITDDLSYERARFLGGKRLGQVFLDDRQFRITSYNVCYTKLLRLLALQAADLLVGNAEEPQALARGRQGALLVRRRRRG